MTKEELIELSEETFFDNDEGLIEPGAHRNFNEELISSTLLGAEFFSEYEDGVPVTEAIPVTEEGVLQIPRPVFGAELISPATEESVPVATPIPITPEGILQIPEQTAADSIEWQDFNITSIDTWNDAYHDEYINAFQFAECNGYYLVRFMGDVNFNDYYLNITCSNELTGIVNGSAELCYIPIIFDYGSHFGSLQVYAEDGYTHFSFVPNNGLQGSEYEFSDIMCMIPKRVVD
jgi:hypothetical protein